MKWLFTRIFSLCQKLIKIRKKNSIISFYLPKNIVVHTWKKCVFTSNHYFEGQMLLYFISNPNVFNSEIQNNNVTLKQWLNMLKRFTIRISNVWFAKYITVKSIDSCTRNQELQYCFFHQVLVSFLFASKSILSYIILNCWKQANSYLLMAG